MAPSRPNVLVILTDQQRGDALRCAWPAWRGDTPLRTPRLDALAAQGVRLARHHVSNPLCMPQRATLLTGLTPRGHNVRTNGIDLDPRFPTLPGELAKAGYRTHSVGKIHARIFDGPKGLDPATLDPREFAEAKPMWDAGRITSLPCPYYGFQSADFLGGHTSWIWGDYVRWLEQRRPGGTALYSFEKGQAAASGAEQSWKMAIPPELHYNTWVADRTIAFMEQAAQDGAPFYLSASFPDPHHAFAVPDPWYSMYDRTTIPLPVRRDGELADLAPHFKIIYDEGYPHPLAGRHKPTKMRDDQIREIIAITWGMVSFVDEQAGRILDALDRLNLAKDTIVVFTSDHGDLLGDHGLLNKGPFHFDGLLRVPSLWRWPGRFPAGRVVEGLSSHTDFVPTICDLTGIPQPEFGPPPGTKIESVKQLRGLPGRSLAPMLAGDDPSVQGAVVIENDEDYLGLRLRTLITPTHQITIYVTEHGEEPYGELFDLEKDPGQLANLWADPHFRLVKAELKDRLLAELIRTDSRLPRRSSHA